MIFHENHLLADYSHAPADDSHENIVPYFCRKLGKMLQNLLSAAVVIGALRANFDRNVQYPRYFLFDLISQS